MRSDLKKIPKGNHENAQNLPQNYVGKKVLRLNNSMLDLSLKNIQYDKKYIPHNYSLLFFCLVHLQQM